MFSGPAAIIQLARLGDLAQTIPLIRALGRDKPVHLVCDAVVKDWAGLLPGVSHLHCLDTRKWRSRCSKGLEGIGSLLDDLRAELAGLDHCHAREVYPLNDFPIANLLAAELASPQGDWANTHLLLVRSYIRLMGSLHRLNRIHLSDLWLSLSGKSLPLEKAPLKIPASGTQFALTVLESFDRRNIKRRWAVILGSGAKSRRFEPEDFAAWWSALPTDDRPGLVLLGGPGEEALGAQFTSKVKDPSPEILNLTGVCSPAELLGVFAAVDLVIGVDTGPLHWAAAVGTKTLGLYFGEAGFHDTGPYGNGHLVVHPDCPEYPCHPARASGCGWRCKEAYRQPGNMAGLLMVQAQGRTFAGPPSGLRLSVSRLNTGGNRYGSWDGSVDSPEITAFEILARRILRLEGQSGEDAIPNLSAAQMKQLQTLCAAWVGEVEQLSFGAAIPNEIQQEARGSASDRIRQVSLEFLPGWNAEYERPAAERCLFSGQLACPGA